MFFRQACLTFRDKNPSCIFCKRTDGALKDPLADFFRNEHRGDDGGNSVWPITRGGVLQRITIVPRHPILAVAR